MRLLAAVGLMALCVSIHAGGVAQALQNLRPRVESASGFWRETWLFVLAAVWMVLLHLIGDRRLGRFLCLERRVSRSADGLLLQRRDVYDDRLRRFGTA